MTRAEIVAVGESGRVDEQRPAIAARRRRRAFDAERAGPRRLACPASTVGAPPRSGVNSTRGRPAFSGLKSCERRRCTAKARRLPGDERRILHVQLGLVRPVRDVRASAARLRRRRPCATAAPGRSATATASIDERVVVVIIGISHPLTNSSSISACRTAASSAACRTRADDAGAIRVEQFEDAALAGVVADLRDPLDLDRRCSRPRSRYRSAVSRRSTTAARSAAISARSATRNASARASACARARLGQRPFGTAAIEQRNRWRARVNDAADVAAADGRRLRAGHDFRLGNPPPVGGALGEARRLDLLAQRQQLAARRLGALDQRVDRRAAPAAPATRRRRRCATDRPARRRSPRGVACARARSVAAAARSASTSSTSRSARSRSKPAASPAASRLARMSASSRSRSRAAVSSRSRTCAATSCANASRRSARARRIASSARLDAGVDQSRRRLHFEAAPPGDRQRLRDHHHVLGDAGDRLAIEREPRIRPSAGREHVGAGDVDAGADRAHARTVGRQPRQRLGLGQRQRLGADARAADCTPPAWRRAPQCA